MDSFPEEVLFALAQKGGARLALLCRRRGFRAARGISPVRVARFCARPEVRRAAVSAHYFRLTNKGKYLFLERALRSPGDAYETLLPFLEADPKEVRRIAAALLNAPEPLGPAADRLVAFGNARPCIWFAVGARPDAACLFRAHPGVDRAAVGAAYASLVAEVRGGLVVPDREELPLFLWGRPGAMRRARATGAPIAFYETRSTCDCQQLNRYIGSLGNRMNRYHILPPALGGACSCGGLAPIASLYETAQAGGAAEEVIADLARATAPLPPSGEEGGDGSEDVLDLSDPGTRETLEAWFAFAPAISRWLTERAEIHSIC